jgi:hypothetical protein
MEADKIGDTVETGPSIEEFKVLVELTPVFDTQIKVN